MHKSIQKIVKTFTIFEKGTPGTPTLATFACMKGLKYAPASHKIPSFSFLMKGK